MIKYRTRFLLSLTLMALLLPVLAGAAKYAGDSFSLGVGGRGLALGGAVIAGPFDGTAAYWNPAGINRLSGKNFTAMHAETFGSLLNHDFLAYNSHRGENSQGRINAYGVYLYYLGGGGIKITDLDPSGRPYVVREESHGDWLLAAAFSSRIAPGIDLGLTGRLIYRDLGLESGYGISLDVGALYRPCRRIQLGLMVTDITSGVIRYSNRSESIYPTVKPGIMIEYTRSDFTGRAMASGDIKFENIKLGAQYWSGPLSLDTHFGWELGWKGMLFGRAGFDIGRFTTGLGVLFRKISFDFAYLHHDAFDGTYRMSAGYQF